MAEIEARFPPKLEFLFTPKRYKVAYGGRGGAKSWGFARALLILASQRRMRIVCAREVQKSIRDSVHKLLSDQIEGMQLPGYTVLRDEIRNVLGSEFVFFGLHDQTAATIKSFEGADICWVEEAQALSRRSLQILLPTIRKAGSEVWFSFNPELDSDAVYQRFVREPDDDAVVVKIGYADNPWLPPELERERLHCQIHDPADYEWIWEGNCRPAVEGAIYAAEVAEAEQAGRFTFVPYEPKLKVHVICDLGFNDSMAIILAQRQVSELRIIDYLEDSHRTLDSYSSELRDKRLNWGTMFLPHDAKQKTLSSAGLSTDDLFRKLGWQTSIVPDAGIEGGIKRARMALAKSYFDRGKTGRLIECLKRYRRTVPTTTGEPGNPVHDEFSHGADAFRYLALIADSMKNESGNLTAPLRYDNRGIV